MKNLFNSIYIFVVFLFFNVSGYAQLYPVQLTPIFNSPYSVKISDYATSMDTKLQLLINPTDITISQRRVRLKLYIQGNGLNIQSSDFAQEQRPIFINGGELQTLTNVDIASLFRLENLQGISPAQYANPLPEGMYNFCFEMYDFATNQKISQKSCAGLYLILNDPPILNTPQKNEQIASTEFPNILFTWTPRQINATNVSYKFELKQLFDPTLDPQIGFQMAPILYEETLFGTALLYNLSMPILTPGLRYAWRVRAVSTTGLSENAVFKNDGYSEIYSFKYTASCAAPTFLLSEAQSSKSVKITWEGVPEHTRYQVQYKKQDVRNAQWFSSNSLNKQSLITNLEPGVTYQFRVGSSCDPVEDGVQSFTYSGINTFTTPTETNGVPAYNCGIVPQINIQNQKPLTNLIQSETFKAGDFPVTILELKGENSPYSGRGYIIVPYLADTKIAVEFKDIVINTDYQLISGIVETSYNPDWKNVTDVEDFTGEGQGGQIEETVPFIIKDIVINPNGDIVVNGVDGQQVIIPGGKDTVITDSGVKDADGNVIVPPKVYTVDSEGNGSNQGVAVADGGKPTPENTDGVDKSGQATAFTAKGISIAFSGNGSKYAFDVMPSNASSALQKLYKKVDNKALPYKAVLNGDSDTLLGTVTVTDSNIKLDSIVFKTQNGAKINFTRNDKVFVLTVKGNLSYAEEQILATVKQGKKWQVIGAFMLVHISPKDVNVALVPTDDASRDKLDEISTETQKIYSKVGVKINFKKEQILEGFERVVPNSVTKIQTEKNTLTSTYSAEQQAINALYKGDGNSYVLFVTNKASSTGQDGYMRLNGQFGYVFNSASGKTPAHELGHGIFKLEHPFVAYKTSEKSTDFLMDYSSGTVLNHQDWKQINDPAFKLYAFQSQSSGEDRTNDGIDLVGNIISKVVFNKTDNTLIGFISNDKKYLRTGYREYKASDKSIVATYNAIVDNGKVLYKDTNGNSMPYAVETRESGIAKIGLINGDGCTYSETSILEWHKPSGSTTENVTSFIEQKIASQKPKWETKTFYKADGSCGLAISILDLVKNDGKNTCTPEIVDKDTKKLNDLFDKANYTNEEVVELVVKGKICFGALRNISWEKQNKSIKQLGLAKAIPEDNEVAILRLISAVQAENYPNLIKSLENNNNELLISLLDKVHNRSINPFDGNNFTSLMKGFVYIFNEINKTKLEDSNLVIENINVVQNSYLFPDDKQQMFNVLFKDKQLNINQGVWDVKKECKWVAGFGDDGSEECKIISQEVIWEQPIKVTPFQPISLSKESDLSLIGGVVTDVEVPVLPAIALYFANNQAEVKNMSEYVRTTLDIVTLLVPVTKLATGPRWLAKTFAFVDKWNKVNSGVNLLVNSTPLKNNPAVAEVLETYNSITVGMNLTTLAGGLSKVAVAKFIQASERKAAKQALLQAAKDGDKDAQMILDIQKELRDYGNLKFGPNWWQTVLSSGETITNNLKKIIGKSSSENIIWKNIDDKNIIWADAKSNILSTPKTFAAETGTSLYDIVLENGYYVKFDVNDGRILLGNTNGNYNAFAVINDVELGAFKTSTLTASEEVFNTKLKQLLISNAEKLKVLSGVVTKQLSIGGKTITLSTTKVNSLLGRFRPDVANLFNELGSFKNVGLGETKGGINILNKPDFYYNADTWWNAYNKPWLDKAINRGDDIYLATIPQKADDIIKDGKLLGAYAQELDHLATRNYKPKNITEDVWNNIKAWLKTTDDYIKSVASAKAKELISTLSKIEPAVTDDLVNLAKNNGGRMEGLDFRLKTLESLERKLISDGVNEPMNDVLRYTVIIDDDLAKGTNAIMQGLESKGYQTIKVKNTFQDGKLYKGINTNVKSPGGSVFEIQYHTSESFNVKQNINHSLYEQYRLLNPKSAEAIKLEQQMIINSNSIKLPVNISSIKSY